MRRTLIGAMVGFGVCYVAASLALGSPPDTTDSGRVVVRWFADNQSHVRWWLWFSTFALVFFGVYAALVRTRLPSPHRDVFFAGGVVLIAVSAVQGWILGGLALHPLQLQPSSARLALDISAYWGPVLICATILLLAPVTHLALTGQAGLPQWLGWLTGVTLVEQVVESITIFGTHGFTEPGGPMNLQLGAGLTTVSLLAIGIVIAREPVPA